jgi:2,6-dihydroxypseudooxynicotine hydrolase
MDPSPTVVAVAQLAITVAEPDANRQAAAAAVAEAAAAGARLVVLPELSDSGYVFDSAAPAREARGLAAPAADNATLRQWHQLAGRHRLVIVGGFCELGADGRLYNSAALVDASGVRAVYRKAHLWDNEKLVFTPGDAAPALVDTEVGRVAVMVCYDLEFPEWARLAALDGADIIAAPVNWPGYRWPPGERPAEVVKAQAAAALNGVFVAVADRCRTERGVSWISGSLIAGQDGYPLAGPVLADRAAVLTAACDLPRARDKRVSGHNDLLADRRPELYAWAPDKRVAAATAHWAARFVSNGTSYPDFQATLARIGRWDDWCREWGRTAEHYEQLAGTAEAAGRLVTAGEAWRRAALCWHWGKFVFTDHPAEQRAAHERTVACFRRGAGTLSPPAEPVRVPYAGSTLAAYLRIPPASASPGPGPVVIMIPGLDSVKEELQATAEHLLRRRLAVIAIDGPGQGESEYEFPIEPAYERVTTAVADYLKGRDDIDADRMGVFGVSLGGYYAARSAAYEPRVRAAVELAGPYRFDLDWDTLPPQTRTTFQYRSGAASPDEARARAAALTLEDAAARITCPLLVAHGGRDRLIPPYHAERLAREVPAAELMLYPDGSHGLTNHAFESRAAMADWLAARL